MDVRTLRECCHQGGLLAQARTAADGRVGYLCLSAAQAAELQVSYEDMKKAAYQMADCSDIRIALAALEQGPGHWRFSARTNETELDVSRYFLPFGGGGHPHAAGLILDTADVRPALQSILNAMAADLAAEETHLTGEILE